MTIYFLGIISDYALQVYLDNSDRLGVAKVSELFWNPSYPGTFQSTNTVVMSEKCKSYSGIRVTSVRVIETHLCIQGYSCFIGTFKHDAE